MKQFMKRSQVQGARGSGIRAAEKCRGVGWAEKQAVRGENTKCYREKNEKKQMDLIQK